MRYKYFNVIGNKLHLKSEYKSLLGDILFGIFIISSIFSTITILVFITVKGL